MEDLPPYSTYLYFRKNKLIQSVYLPRKLPVLTLIERYNLDFMEVCACPERLNQLKYLSLYQISV